jgi:class 3 adenylate cyclase
MALSDSGSPEQGQRPEQKNKTSRRSLRAVFAADIAAFSGAMSANETSAVSTLSEVRSIAVQQLQIHGGWLFGMPGDGIFALFESAVNAVRCALDTQQQLALRGEAETMRLRIGIHLGDVLFENDLPYGEALTIAARLEALADPGGILISGAVMDAVCARISATFDERGVPRLKNIPRRIVTFAVRPPPERSKADETRVGMSILDRTTHLDAETLRAVRDQQFIEQMADHASQSANEAIIVDERNVVQSGAMNGHIMPAVRETKPLNKDLAGAQTQPENSATTHVAPAAATPSEDSSKLVRHEPPAPQPAKTTIPRSASALEAEPALLTEADKYRPPVGCIEALTAALAVHLGPLAKVLINRSLKDASSIDHLVAMIEEQIQSNEERFQFRIRASHICKTFSDRPSEEA